MHTCSNWERGQISSSQRKLSRFSARSCLACFRLHTRNFGGKRNSSIERNFIRTVALAKLHPVYGFSCHVIEGSPVYRTGLLVAHSNFNSKLHRWIVASRQRRAGDPYSSRDTYQYSKITVSNDVGCGSGICRLVTRTTVPETPESQYTVQRRASSSSSSCPISTLLVTFDFLKQSIRCNNLEDEGCRRFRV